MNLPPLSDEEKAIYEWQMWVPGVGEEGQRRLKGSSVLVSRVGGLGGVAALELAAAGVGKLILAHYGNLKPSDLNRQVLMRHAAIGSSRVACASATLRSLNPRLEIVAVNQNVRPENVQGLVEQADVIVSCAPLFEERLLLNAEAVRQRKPMVDCAMYELSGQITTIVPGRGPCLACRVPNPPEDWKRQFPVFGAVSGMAGCVGAMEAIKLICGVGEPLINQLLVFDLRDMRFRRFGLRPREDCAVCGSSGVRPGAPTGTG